MAINYAQIDSRSAFLSTDFGEEIARKWFGDESVNALPRYTRGPRKGKIKGAVTWSKIIRGGWVRTGRETASGSASGYVETRVGMIFDRKLHEINSDRFGTTIGKVIRDLDQEEAQRKIQQIVMMTCDSMLRYYEFKRTELEQVLLTADIKSDVIQIVQEKIAEYNEDIAILTKELQQ
jgi:hypothetical protein